MQSCPLKILANPSSTYHDLNYADYKSGLRSIFSVPKQHGTNSAEKGIWLPCRSRYGRLATL